MVLNAAALPMTPLSAALGGEPLVGWRLDPPDEAETWDSGNGPLRDGGRWSLPGVAAVYASLDPATAILETVVNAGIGAVRRSRPVLTGFRVDPRADVRVVRPEDVPDAEWLTCEAPTAGQQGWGTDLLGVHAFIVVPSACSTRSWNVVFDPGRARGAYALLGQERLAL